MSAGLKIAWIAMIFLVLASLISNAYLINEARDLQNQINGASGTAGEALDAAIEQLAAVETEEFTMVVPIDEVIPVNATIEFDEEFQVPIDVVVPIDTSVQVPLQLGLLGEFDLDIPIRTDVPISITVPIRIQRDVPIETTVPVKLDVPITLSLRGTPMADELRHWREVISELRAQLPGPEDVQITPSN